MLHTADEIKGWDVDKECEDGYWRQARPINFKYDRWCDRLAWAWGVLTGQYDALYWR